MLHVSALFWAIIRHTLQELLFFSFVLQFLSYCIGDPFCITNHNYCLYGVRCPLLFVIWGGGFFPLVNLPVVLVYGHGRGSCHLDFCVDVCLPDRRWARASVPLWCILLLAGVVGFYCRILIEHPSLFLTLYVCTVFILKTSILRI